MPQPHRARSARLPGLHAPRTRTEISAAESALNGSSIEPPAKKRRVRRDEPTSSSSVPAFPPSPFVTDAFAVTPASFAPAPVASAPLSPPSPPLAEAPASAGAAPLVPVRLGALAHGQLGNDNDLHAARTRALDERARAIPKETQRAYAPRFKSWEVRIAPKMEGSGPDLGVEILRPSAVRQRGSCGGRQSDSLAGRGGAGPHRQGAEKEEEEEELGPEEGRGCARD